MIDTSVLGECLACGPKQLTEESVIRLVWNSPSAVILCFSPTYSAISGYTMSSVHSLQLKKQFLLPNCFFFWGFCFTNSIHYPLSLCPINSKPQFTWKCTTMKSLCSVCVCVSHYAAYTAAGFNVVVTGSYSLLTAVLSSLRYDLKSLTWCLCFRTAVPCNLIAITGCFRAKTKLGVDMEAWLQVMDPWFQERSKRKIMSPLPHLFSAGTVSFPRMVGSGNSGRTEFWSQGPFQLYTPWPDGLNS